MSDVTEIVSAMTPDDPAASEQLLPLVYRELRRLAAAKLSNESPNQTLQPTVLVHEAYVRLVDVEQPQRWNGRGHFFAAAAEAMRRIIIENARRKQTAKRGGDCVRVDMENIDLASESRRDELLALDEALGRLEERWPGRAQIVKLRYFAGLTIPDAAQVAGVSHATADRHWAFARAWLHAQLKNDGK